MVRQGWGRVVFVSSESALNIPKEMIHYGMTKTAQLAVSRGVAESVAGTGVTVNAVLPGPTRSEFLQNWLEPMAKQTGKSLEELEQDFLSANRPTSIIKYQTFCVHRRGREHGCVRLLTTVGPSSLKPTPERKTVAIRSRPLIT
jgi:NAD(P)-dependent dehydrogenase (short-subunit alcohol dehydrogenase family)